MLIFLTITNVRFGQTCIYADDESGSELAVDFTASSAVSVTHQAVYEISGLSSKPANPVSITRQARVYLNAATEFEMETLPGITPADAEAIIENRP